MLMWNPKLGTPCNASAANTGLTAVVRVGSVEFSIRANPAIREAVALVSLEDTPVLELAIQLPAAWPLQDAKLECRKGVSPIIPHKRRSA